MAETLTCDKQWERSALPGTMSLALQKCRRNSNYKNCGIRWLFLSDTDLLEREYNGVRYINQQCRAKCERHRSYLTVFKDFYNYKADFA